jgi:hypothetical protein
VRFEAERRLSVPLLDLYEELSSFDPSESYSLDAYDEVFDEGPRDLELDETEEACFQVMFGIANGFGVKPALLGVLLGLNI